MQLKCILPAPSCWLYVLAHLLIAINIFIKYVNKTQLPLTLVQSFLSYTAAVSSINHQAEKKRVAATIDATPFRLPSQSILQLHEIWSRQPDIYNYIKLLVTVAVTVLS